MLNKFRRKEEKKREKFRVMDKVDLEQFDLKMQKYIVERCVDRGTMRFEEPRMSDEGLKCPQGYQSIKILTRQGSDAFLIDSGAINKRGSLLYKMDGEGKIITPFLFQKLEDMLEQWEWWKRKKMYAKMKQLEEYDDIARS